MRVSVCANIEIQLAAPAVAEAALNRVVIVISLFVRCPPALTPITASRSASATPCDEGVDAREHVRVHVPEVAADDIAQKAVPIARAAAVVGRRTA